MLQKLNEDQIIAITEDPEHRSLWSNKCYRKGTLMYQKDNLIDGLMFIEKGAVGLYGYQQADYQTKVLNIPQGHIIGQQCFSVSKYCLYDVFAEEDVESKFLHQDYFHVLQIQDLKYFDLLMNYLIFNLLDRVRLIINQNSIYFPHHTANTMSPIDDLSTFKKKRNYKMRDRLVHQLAFDLWSEKSIQYLCGHSEQFEIKRSGVFNFNDKNKLLMILEGSIQMRISIKQQEVFLDPLPHGLLFHPLIWNSDLFEIDFRVRDYANILIVDHDLITAGWFKRFYSHRQIQSVIIVINSLLQVLTRLITEHTILKRQ
ncbi:MAG: hypothetical protein CMF42_04040 [Legionellales bacterium]|nr:hypothetical protein [Legionellales bacterium]OUX67514.1 MAG: hypothetical protein CBD38_02420 [bacterium TMED178]